ncbi:MAG: DUF6443 domain-containing protein, partial [Tannerellaceae bacterium]|nr:DUF6443 domain-containing protein [Tannerellaceae bacterium]
MKNKYIQSIICLCCFLLHTLCGYAQTFTENYVLKRVMYGTGSNDYVEEISYLDGLGRPVEKVQRAFTPSGKDLASFTEYDTYGRVEKEWLPAVVGVSTGAFQSLSSLQSSSKSINADDSPYSSYTYEQSPLNRVQKESGPGKVWYTAGRGITHRYTSNSATEAKTSAYMLKGTATQVVRSGTYPAGTLKVKIVVNEDGDEFYEFTDKEGRVVLSRQFNDVEVLSTYYVYDDYGNLTHVLPPL